MQSHKHKTLSYLPFFITIFVLLGNLIIASLNVSNQIQKDLNNQLHILSYETGQVLDTNSIILKHLVKNIELNLNNKQNSSLLGTSHKIDNSLKTVFQTFIEAPPPYSNTLIVLTNKDHIILDSSKKSHDSPKTTINLSNRQYLHNTTKSQSIQIGDLITGAISKAWSIPIAKAITNSKGEFLGAIIISIPLSKFSESVYSSNINLSSIMLDEPNEAMTQPTTNINTIISAPLILKIAFSKQFNIFITSPLDNLNRIASFKLNSQSVSEYFWNEYLSHSLISICLLVIIFIGFRSLKKQIIDPLTQIREQLLHSAQALQILIPDYKIQDNLDTTTPLLTQDHYSDSLIKIEKYVTANQLVISTLQHQKNMLEIKDQQLVLLQSNFTSCMKSLQESGKCVSENIDDIILQNKKLRRTDASKILIATLKQIYDYSTTHVKRITDFEDTIKMAWEIVQTPKKEIDLHSFLQQLITTKKNIISINNENNVNKILKRKFYPAAIEKTISHVLSAFKNDDELNIKLNETNLGISIDVTCIINNNSLNVIDNSRLQSSLEKARLFALLDSGIISLYNTQEQTVLCIMYTF